MTQREPKTIFFTQTQTQYSAQDETQHAVGGHFPSSLQAPLPSQYAVPRGEQDTVLCLCDKNKLRENTSSGNSLARVNKP